MQLSTLILAAIVLVALVSLASAQSSDDKVSKYSYDNIRTLALNDVERWIGMAEEILSITMTRLFPGGLIDKSIVKKVVKFVGDIAVSAGKVVLSVVESLWRNYGASVLAIIVGQ